MPLERRTTLMAVLIAAPALAAAIGLTSLEVYRMIAPDAAVFGDPPAQSLSEAITRGRGVEAAFPFIRDGQDPNAPIVIDDEDYTGGGQMRVSPLVAAIASRDSNIVQMLLNFGARIDLPQNRDAWCFAHVLGDETMQKVIADAGSPADPEGCPRRDWTAGQPPLSWFR